MYRIVQGKKSFYLKDEQALAKFKLTSTTNYEVRRFKGLGEQSVEELSESTMEIGNRTIKQITMDDIGGANMTFVSLMGESVTPRKTFIENNAHKAKVDV